MHPQLHRHDGRSEVPSLPLPTACLGGGLLEGDGGQLVHRRQQRPAGQLKGAYLEAEAARDQGTNAAAAEEEEEGQAD